MKIFKNVFLTLCSLILAPVFSANAEENNVTLEAGCYQIETGQQEVSMFCLNRNLDMRKVSDEDLIDAGEIEDVDIILESEPVTLTLT